jgi:hypothetical protein
MIETQHYHLTSYLVFKERRFREQRFLGETNVTVNLNPLFFSMLQ